MCSYRTGSSMMVCSSILTKYSNTDKIQQISNNSSANFMTRTLPFNNYNLGFWRKKRLSCRVKYFQCKITCKCFSFGGRVTRRLVGIYNFPDYLFWKNKQNPVKTKLLRGSSNRLIDSSLSSVYKWRKDC